MTTHVSYVYEIWVVTFHYLKEFAYKINNNTMNLNLNLNLKVSVKYAKFLIAIKSKELAQAATIEGSLD